MQWQTLIVTDLTLVLGFVVCLLLIAALALISSKQRAQIRKLEESLLAKDVIIEDLREGRDYYRNLARRYGRKR